MLCSEQLANYQETKFCYSKSVEAYLSCSFSAIKCREPLAAAHAVLMSHLLHFGKPKKQKIFLE